MKIRLNILEFFTCKQTDEETDMAKITRAFFANFRCDAPKNVTAGTSKYKNRTLHVYID